MNTKNLLIASVIGAVATTVLVSIPFVNLLVCVVCLPLWGGPLLATWIYKRQNGTMPMNHAITVGIVTGVLAGVLGFIVSLVLGPVTTAAMTNLLQQYMPSGGVPLDAANSAPSIGALLIGVVFDIIFGLVGGLIGGSLFKDKTTPLAPPMSPTA